MGQGDLEQWLATIRELGSEELDLRHDVGKSYGGTQKIYGSTAYGVRGAFLAWNPWSPEGPGELRIEIKGRFLSCCTADDVWVYVSALRHSGASFKRMDVAFDDYSKSIPYKQVVDALEAGQFARFRTHNYRVGSDGGWTVYMGSRNAEKMTRYYNKSVESKGDIDSYRWEVELKDFKAEQMVDAMMCINPVDDPDTYIELLMKSIFGAVDFLDKSDKNLDRCERLPWWSAFLQRVLGGQDVIRYAAQKFKSTITKSMRNLQRIAPSIKCIQRVIGVTAFHNFVMQLLEDGDRRQSVRHDNMVEANKRTKINQVWQLLSEGIDLLPST